MNPGTLVTLKERRSVICMSNEVWIKVTELGFRRHSANVYLIIKRYKRKKGYGLYEKTKNYNGYWSGRKIGEFKTLEELLAYLREGNTFWHVNVKDVEKELEKAGWR